MPSSPRRSSFLAIPVFRLTIPDRRPSALACRTAADQLLEQDQRGLLTARASGPAPGARTRRSCSAARSRVPRSRPGAETRTAPPGFRRVPCASGRASRPGSARSRAAPPPVPAPVHRAASRPSWIPPKPRGDLTSGGSRRALSTLFPRGACVPQIANSGGVPPESRLNSSGSPPRAPPGRVDRALRRLPAETALESPNRRRCAWAQLRRRRRAPRRDRYAFCLCEDFVQTHCVVLERRWLLRCNILRSGARTAHTCAGAGAFRCGGCTRSRRGRRTPCTSRGRETRPCCAATQARRTGRTHQRGPVRQSACSTQ